MNDPENTAPQIATLLEQQLNIARKEKTAAQVPAIRRLRTAVIVFLVLGLFIQIAVLGLGWTFGAVIKPIIDAAALGFISVAAFWLDVVVSCVSIAVGWLQLLAYLRFLKQYKQNEVLHLSGTIRMLRTIVLLTLLLVFVATLLPALMYQNIEILFMGLVQSILTLLMPLILLHYIKTAQAEIPTLLANVGDNVAEGKYQSWRSLFVKLMAAALVIFTASYLLGVVSVRAN